MRSATLAAVGRPKRPKISPNTSASPPETASRSPFTHRSRMFCRQLLRSSSASRRSRRGRRGAIVRGERGSATSWALAGPGCAAARRVSAALLRSSHASTSRAIRSSSLRCAAAESWSMATKSIRCSEGLVCGGQG